MILEEVLSPPRLRLFLQAHQLLQVLVQVLRLLQAHQDLLLQAQVLQFPQAQVHLLQYRRQHQFHQVLLKVDRQAQVHPQVKVQVHRLLPVLQVLRVLHNLRAQVPVLP